MVGIEPTTQKKLSVDDTIFKDISGVLVGLATCKRLADRLPILSVIILSPPETAG